MQFLAGVWRLKRVQAYCPSCGHRLKVKNGMIMIAGSLDVYELRSRKMTDPFRFRPRKKRASVYFNDGHHAMWVEADDEHRDNPNPLLIEAINAAWREFNRVFSRKPKQPK